ncbi:DUF192 domain-containing protein [Massilia sp. S19_KUP03_FR1]|uniref:DUF192 domain-containing protein n=1 Tax=Massilia sp. S19_KUP03_FR1 TaxID=3025503 RepID=UPI002FCCE082
MRAPSLDVDGLQVILAQGFLARLLGLLGQRALPLDHALLITPCNNVHTFWMRFAIDVVFLDRYGVVLAIVPHVAPWRIAAAWRAHACLELAAGGAARFGIAVGRHLPQLAAASLPR